VKYHAELFYLWGHTYEFDDNDNWNVIEDFCAFMGGREADVWYATNMEIYEYVQDYERLVWSVDMTRVCNPTARKLWFCNRNTVYSIEAGETLNLGEE
jgi:hypothetical protein